jgi:opacity protein-like surface antigen
MKKLILSLMITMILFSAASTAIAAVETSGDAYAGVYSKYVWRGFDLSQDDSIVVQAGTNISFGNFTVSWWGNMSENSGELNEVDVVLDYSTDLSDMISVSIGNIFYELDGGFNDSNEAYLSFGLNLPLSPTATVYYDYDEFDTIYTTLGIGHDIELSEALALSLGATGSYLFDDVNGYGTKQEWLHNLELSAGADYAINDLVSVGASVLYSAPLSEKAKRNTGIREEFTGGAAVTLSF